jgi:1-acyl-sn-glycerol-3-phosphate acyltransferase
MQEVLNMGLHMCIYPEGTRNTSSEPLKPFHDGAFRLAISSGKPIIPMVIFNSRKANPPNKTFFLWPIRLYMDFLPEVAVEPNETVEHLKNRVHNQMKDYLIEHQ